MEQDEILDRWDQFVERRSLPYFQGGHRLMMRQLLQRFPFQKLRDVSDHDVAAAVNEDSTRSLKMFMRHLDRFLDLHDLDRSVS
jgi:hypothetical protein